MRLQNVIVFSSWKNKCVATAADAESGANGIRIDEIAFAEQIGKQTTPWLSAV